MATLQGATLTAEEATLDPPVMVAVVEPVKRPQPNSFYENYSNTSS